MTNRPPSGSGSARPGLLRPHHVAWIALGGGAIITAVKFGAFWVTNSVAVLSDALESIINLLAAAMAVVSTWYAARPPDRLHPYGHGNIEFVAVGVEGTLILLAGGGIAYESIRRLVAGAVLRDLTTGLWMLSGIAVLVTALAVFVLRGGRRLGSPTLLADGKHLLTDAVTTIGALAGLLLVKLTGVTWLDPVLALVLAAVIVVTGMRLLRESWRGLIERIDIREDRMMRGILDEEIAAGRIVGYHKLRYRHVGGFHWVDVHIQVEGDMSVRDAHDRISRIEHRLEQALGRANASVHVEPDELATTPEDDPVRR